MSERRKTYEGGLYFVTLTVVGWIDVFNRRLYIEEIIKNIKYCQSQKGLEIYSYCIMSSHIHMIAAAKEGKLSAILKDFKSYTAKQLLNLIEGNFEESRKEWMMNLFRNAGKANSNNDNFQFWQQDNHPIQLITPKFTHQKLDYIHNNPVVEGIVDKPEDYLYSSARDYYGTGKGLLDVILIDPLIVTY